jgi:hypothetical protein
MSWQDRLQEAAYTSPSGTRLKFDYEDVSRETTKRTTAFEFPGVNGAYIQDNGYGARQYPLRCFFWGPEHDRSAVTFEAALLEQGAGKLEHPLYGTFDVVPMGSIGRNDALKTAANQTIVEVTFSTTTGLVYPQAGSDPESEIATALDALRTQAAEQFATNANLKSAVHRASVTASIRKLIKSVDAALEPVAAGVSAVNRQFHDLEDSIVLGMEVLIGKPIALAEQISDLLKEPGKALARIEDRLDAYEAMLDDIFGSSAGDPATALESGAFIPNRVIKIANDFTAADLFAMNTIGGAVNAVLETTFTTRPQAIKAATRLLGFLDDAVVWRDAGFEALATVDDVGNFQVDPGGSYQATQRAVALAAGFLVETSFSLVPERRIVLDRPRTIIDLAAELYGSVDDRLDFLIASNNLTGSEILEIPRLRSIVYYPDVS